MPPIVAIDNRYLIAIDVTLMLGRHLDVGQVRVELAVGGGEPASHLGQGPQGRGPSCHQRSRAFLRGWPSLSMYGPARER